MLSSVFIRAGGILYIGALYFSLPVSAMDLTGKWMLKCREVGVKGNTHYENVILYYTKSEVTVTHQIFLNKNCVTKVHDATIHFVYRLGKPFKTRHGELVTPVDYFIRNKRGTRNRDRYNIVYLEKNKAYYGLVNRYYKAISPQSRPQVLDRSTVYVRVPDS